LDQGHVSSGPDLDRDLRLAASSARDATARARARALAATLRDGTDQEATADLLEQLCDDAEGARRQVARLGFDLHDGALQELLALRNDLQFFRGQIMDVLEQSEHRQRVVGRVDDFLARVDSLDGSLRDVAIATQAPWIVTESLSAALAAVVDVGIETCSVQATLDPDLDECRLTDSQKIAIVKVVQSALDNVLQHSGASTAWVTVACTSSGIEGRIVDDGHGFDVDAALTRAAEERRLGLVGMRERIRLLGGSFSVTSCAGGPTRVEFDLRRLPPR
jgi:signal transduction histidine kinase